MNQKLLDDLRKINNEVVFIQTGPNFIEIMPVDVDKEIHQNTLMIIIINCH